MDRDNNQTPEQPRGPRHTEREAEQPRRRPSSRSAADDTANALLALNRRQPPRPDASAPRDAPSADALDVVDADRILELPARRSGARAEGVTPDPARDADAPLPLRPSTRAFPSNRLRAVPPARLRPVPDHEAAPKPMLSLREAAQPYLTRLAAKRPPEPQDAGRDAKPSGRMKPAPQAGPPVCPRCHGAGYLRLDVPVGHKDFGKAYVCDCKQKEIEARSRSKLRELSSLGPFIEKTFDTIDPQVPGMREAVEVAFRYAQNPEGWLILQGGYGCGKTHLAAAIALKYEEEVGHTVFFSIVPDLLDHLRAAFAPTSEITYDALFYRVKDADLLVLDDLGSENATAWATEKLFQIINHRYNYRLPTVITTNVRQFERLDDRIHSRLLDVGLVRRVVIEAKDYRIRHVGPGGRPPRGNGGSGAGRGRGGYGR